MLHKQCPVISKMPRMVSLLWNSELPCPFLVLHLSWRKIFHSTFLDQMPGNYSVLCHSNIRVWLENFILNQCSIILLPSAATCRYHSTAVQTLPAQALESVIKLGSLVCAATSRPGLIRSFFIFVFKRPKGSSAHYQLMICKFAV